MSRSDGKFPALTKLQIDPDVWPSNYYAKSQRCTECNENWPMPHLFRPSVCCDAPTKPSDNAPDMRWPEAVTQLLQRRFERYYDEYNEGFTDEELQWDETTLREEVEKLIEDTSRVECTAGE